MNDDLPWSEDIRLSEIQRGATSRHLEADERTRKRIAKVLDLVALDRLEADLAFKPWLDGAELTGRWRADIVQTCGVSLEAFPTSLSGDFNVRVVPPDSPNAPTDESDLAIDPDAEDPPEALEGEHIDLAAYVVEHLAMEIDPFPRKPGAVFEQPPEPGLTSPFAALKSLLPKDDEA